MNASVNETPRSDSEITSGRLFLRTGCRSISRTSAINRVSRTSDKSTSRTSDRNRVSRTGD